MSSTECTAEQAKTTNIAKMGQDIGAAYSTLWQQVALINKKWGQYVELFGTSPERINLLNRAAPSMFRTIQDTLWQDILLNLARLTDPPKSTNKKNLSVRHLSELLANSPIGTQVETLAKTTLSKCQFARDWRNRRIAHSDLDLALGQSTQPLAPASRRAVKEALASLEELLNSVSLHYLNSTTIFHLGSDSADAVSLLYILKDGLQYQQDRIDSIKQGHYRQEDHTHDRL